VQLRVDEEERRKEEKEKEEGEEGEDIGTCPRQYTRET
jgi:hypothetical protein